MSGGGNFITENYPTLHPTFSVRKVLTNGDSEGNYREVTASEKATIERNVAKLIEAGNGVRTERTPLFEAAGAKFNDKTGYYELNGLTDLTGLDMEKVAALGSPVMVNYALSKENFKARTVVRLSNKNGFYTGDFYAICVENSSIEVVNIDYYMSGRTLYNSFQNCPRLRAIGVGTQYLDFDKYIKWQSRNETFRLSPKLEHVLIMRLRSDIDFSDCPLLDYDSVSYMVNNAANTSPITIYVHADVMAKLNDETNTEWHQILTDAAAKQITFATLT